MIQGNFLYFYINKVLEKLTDSIFSRTVKVALCVCTCIPIKGSFFLNLIKKWKYMYFSLIITIHVMQRMSLCALIVMLLWPLDSCLLKFFLKNYCAVQIGIFIEKTKQNNPSLLYCFDQITRGPSPHHSPEKQQTHLRKAMIIP